MSLLKNHNNDFEKKLKKHVGDTEYKPAESLWDKIDKEVNRPKFEQRVESKIGRYELMPEPQTWEYIETHLPPEPKAQKHALKLWYSITLLLFAGGILIGYQLNKQSIETMVQKQSTGLNMLSENPVLETTKPVPDRIQTDSKSEHLSNTLHYAIRDKKAEEQVTNKPLAIAYLPIVPDRYKTYTNELKTDSYPISSSTQRNEVNANLISQAPRVRLQSEITLKNNALVVKQEAKPANNKNIISGKNPQSPLNPDTNEIMSVNGINAEIVTTEHNQPQDTFINNSKSENFGNQVTALNDFSANNSTILSPDNPNQPARLSISIIAGIHQNYMQLIAPENMKNNMALRQQVETPEWDFSGGFLIDYTVNKHVLLSSGIILTGFSMGMAYDVLPSNRSAVVEEGASYQNANDSIIEGTVLNSRIKYTWNEIPIFVTYKFSTTKKMGVELRGGISYAIISTVDASMVGQDNIGVLITKNKESFPLFQNSLFTHVYAGLCYQLNETVSINAMPYFRYSINSMIRNDNWIRQHPWMTGLSLGLRKSF